MRISKLITLMALLCPSVFAQQFTLGQQISIPDSLHTKSFDVGDFDNDGLLDFMIIAKDLSEKTQFVFLKGDTTFVPEISSTHSFDSVRSYKIHDYNRDSRLDIVVSDGITGAVYVLQNKGAFQFEQITVSLPPFDFITFGDLNNDLDDECVISANGTGTTIFRQADDEWKVVTDSLHVSLTDFKIFDFDGDGVNDFFYSGIADNQPVSQLMLRNDSAFVVVTSINDVGTSSVIDLDLDGLFELYFVSNEPGSRDHYIVARDSIVAMDSASRTEFAFLADLSNDGRPDKSMLSVNDTDSLNLIVYADSTTHILNAMNLVHQGFADVDGDGSLDAVQMLRSEDIQVLQWEKNEHPKNEAPSAPASSVAAPIFDRTFFYWSEAEDDHTVASAITYGLFVADETDSLTSNFDPETGFRLYPSHGENATANFKLVNRSFTGLTYQIQAVDNALFGSARSVCNGNGFACVTRTDEEILFCRNEQITLSAPDQSALWFSFSSDYLFTGETLTFTPTDGEVVFYFIPAENDCSTLATFLFKTNEDITERAGESIFMCENSERLLQADDSASDISWTSSVYGNLGNETSLNYYASVDDTLSLFYRTSLGCRENKNFHITISAPVVQISPTSPSVMRGESIQLHATGALNYVWSPSTYLDDNELASPLCTPTEDIQYTLVGTDSIGCTGTAAVSVTVETTGFVPTLFSPNADGQNDRLMIYGLSPAKDFQFSIYNREGERVFRTEEYTDALYLGWDGTYQGRLQPEGVYYWKVQGEHLSGRRVFLNGKLEGSIVLIR